MIFAAFVLVAAGAWSLVLIAMSRFGGWTRLAGRYRARDSRPPGAVRRMATAQVGYVWYRGCLTLGFSERGLHLKVFPLFRPGHPPLFIPWGECHDVEEKEILLSPTLAVEVGRPPAGRIRFVGTVCGEVKAWLEEAGGGAAGSAPGAGA